MQLKKGKLTVHVTRGGAKKSYTIGGVFVDNKYFVGRSVTDFAYGRASDISYAIYALDGKSIGIFESAKAARGAAHLLFTKEKFKF